MTNICLCVQIHIPVILRNYRFFEITRNDHYYYDYGVDYHVNRIYNDNLLPFFETVKKLFLVSGGRFKVAISISGITLKLLQNFVPQAINTLNDLVKTGCIEFLSEPWSHSMVAFSDPKTLLMQTLLHDQEIKSLFSMTPNVFIVNSPFCSGKILSSISECGEDIFINKKEYEYLKNKKQTNASVRSIFHINSELSQLLQNLNFQDENFIRKNLAICILKIINNHLSGGNPLIIVYNPVIITRPFIPNCKTTFTTMMKLILSDQEVEFGFPSEMMKKSGQLATEDDSPGKAKCCQTNILSEKWIKNNLQKEAFSKQLAIQKQMKTCNSPSLIHDWNLIQDMDHLYYMHDHFFLKEYGDHNVNPYSSPYLAFINYMNILEDFAGRIGKEKRSFSTINAAGLKFIGSTSKQKMQQNHKNAKLQKALNKQKL